MAGLEFLVCGAEVLIVQGADGILGHRIVRGVLLDGDTGQEAASLMGELYGDFRAAVDARFLCLPVHELQIDDFLQELLIFDGFTRAPCVALLLVEIQDVLGDRNAVHGGQYRAGIGGGGGACVWRHHAGWLLVAGGQAQGHGQGKYGVQFFHKY